jgi:hypothetical protein
VLAEAARQQVELCGVLEADQVTLRVTQRKDLPPREPLQVGEHGQGLLPMMADPRQRVEHQPEILAAEMPKQSLGRLAGPLRVGRQFRPVAADALGVRRSEPGPDPGTGWSNRSLKNLQFFSRRYSYSR